MLSGLIFLLIASAIVTFVALLVSLASNVNRTIKFSFAVISFGLIYWQSMVFITEHIRSNLLIWNNLVFLGPTLALLGSLFFIAQLSKSEAIFFKKQHYIRYGIAVGAILIQVGSILSEKIFVNVTFSPKLGTYSYVRGGFYYAYISGVILIILMLIGQLLVGYSKSKEDPRSRQAFRAVLVTIMATMCYGLVTNALIPVITGSDTYISLGLLSIDIFAFGLAFSIIRYSFLDIRGYAFRTTTYAATLSSLVIIYIFSTALIVNRFLHISLSSRAIAVQAALVLVISLSFQPLRLGFNKLTNKLFYRDYYEPQELLDALTTVLVGTVDIDEIRSRTQEIFGRTLRPASTRFLLRADMTVHERDSVDHFIKSSEDLFVADGLDPRAIAYKTLKNFDAAIAVRLQTKHEDLGFLLLGPRQSGQAYSIADRRLLGVAASELAIGLQNALRFRQIQNFNETLQDKIEEATRKLRQTNEKLRKLDETKDDFISMASHQLRTPLTSVKGYVSMVLDGDAGKITTLQRKLLTQSFISSQRMVYLISDLLNVSRLKTGKFIIEPVPTNLATVIEEEIEQLQETAKGRNLELSYHKPEHFPTLMLDETKIRQVLMNFIDNAVYYTPSGGHIAINLVDKPKTIEFMVVDDGIGVAKHEQPHLFTKFFRAHNAKRARPDGTGLGLFMAKKVIAASGGAIIFKSQEGRGSTFGFTFAKDKLLPPSGKVVAAAKPNPIHVNPANK